MPASSQTRPLRTTRIAARGHASHSEALRGVIRELEALREEHARLGSFVRADRLLDGILGILAPLGTAPEPTYTLTEAAMMTGYSRDHLGRKVTNGEIPNRGRPGAPRVRLSECPTKKLDSPLPVRPASSAQED